MIIIIIIFNVEWSTVTQKFGGFHVYFFFVSSLGQSTYFACCASHSFCFDYILGLFFVSFCNLPWMFLFKLVHIIAMLRLLHLEFPKLVCIFFVRQFECLYVSSFQPVWIILFSVHSLFNVHGLLKLNCNLNASLRQNNSSPPASSTKKIFRVTGDIGWIIDLNPKTKPATISLIIHYSYLFSRE